MDRFKFRVWDKQSNSYTKEKMFYINEFGELFKYEKSKSTVYINAPSPYVMCFCRDNYIPERCTGFTDKNGKLIYEGDIVKGKKINPYSEFYEDYVNYYELEVKWCKTGFDSLNPNIYEYIIIGNIHENKDLLEDK